MAGKVKILYVDDEPINAELFKINFEDNFSVVTASSGFEGLEVLSTNSDTSIVISDMKMPGMSGIDFISKAREKFPEKKYFILTGYDISAEIKTALDEKMILEYFRKPFDIEHIQKSIQSFLS